MRESKFQHDFTDWLRDHNAIPVKQDPAIGRQKGIPDIIAFYRTAYFVLEFKASKTAPYQPGQKQWLERFKDMGVLSMKVYPEIEEQTKQAILAIMAREDMKNED